MSKHGVLGEFEQVVLLSVLRLGDAALGRNIYEEIKRLSETPVTLTAVYVTLSRLADKHYVSSELSEPADGGRAQKLFSLEAAGVEALQRSRSRLERFWAGVELDADSRRP